MDALKSVRKNILSITPYVAGKKPAASGGRQVKLASNENAWGSSPLAMQAIRDVLDEGLSIYPDSKQGTLKTELVRFWQQHAVDLDTGQILWGDGSGEVLSLIMDAFLSPGDGIAIPEKSFILYSLLASRQDARIITSGRRDDFSIDLLDLARKASQQEAKLVILANPDNPTATFKDTVQLREFVEMLPSSTVVVLDEAYIHFAGLEQSALHWMRKYPNLIVSHTFSKAYGLAALRVGYAVMHLDLAVHLEKIRLPFNLGLYQQVGAAAALRDEQFLSETVAETEQGRRRLIEGLIQLGFELPAPPMANFVLVDLGDRADAVYSLLTEKGISIRGLDSFGYGKGYARITVGTAEELDYLFEVLKEL